MATDMETCSLCLSEVPWSSLREHDAGNLCRPCYREETA
jgi:hypothetical protein